MKLKRETIAEALAAEIRTGLHDRGSRLPGEHELAKRFSTSRTTVRQALAILHDADLIATSPAHRGEARPELARIKDRRIVAERWSARGK